MLDSITILCNGFLKGIRAVLRDLNDIPLYAQTYHGSIADFKRRSGKEPLMPLSNILLLCDTKHNKFN